MAFTAAQIPGIADRLYPRELAGAAYPHGIPIRPEEELEALVRSEGVDTVCSDLEPLVPVMGYGKLQMRELSATLNAIDADVVVAGTPIDLRRILAIDKPVVRVRYDLEPASGPSLAALIEPVLRGTTSETPVLA